MRFRPRWIAAAVVVALLAAIGLRAVTSRRAATAVAPAASAPAAALDLASSDVVRAAEVELRRSVPVSGGLVALRSAAVKARIAAEVREVTVREGDRVRAGQVVARLDDTEASWRLRQAEDQAAAARAQLQIAERTLANNQALVDQGFISRNALETSISTVAGARASLQAAQAAVEIARKSVRDAVLTAPLSGSVSQRLVEPGERVGVDARLLEIVDLSQLELEAALAPEDAAGVRIGQRATLQVEGVAAPVGARVARINPSTQSGTRAIVVYLSIDPDPALRQGLFAQGALESGQRRALAVPRTTLRIDRARPYVLTVEQGRVLPRDVTLGVAGEADFGVGPESAVEVTQGLQAGAVVLRSSVGVLREGTAVNVTEGAR